MTTTHMVYRLPPPSDSHPLAVRLGVGRYARWPVADVPVPYLLRIAGQPAEYRRRHPEAYAVLCLTLARYFAEQAGDDL